MKKLFLTATVLGLVSLTSCKSEEQKVQEKVENTRDNVINTVQGHVESGQETLDQVNAIAEKLPTFSNPKATEWVNKFNDLTAQMNVAASTGDQSKLTELSKQSVDLMTELRGITQSLTPEDAKKLQDWTAKVQNSLNR